MRRRKADSSSPSLRAWVGRQHGAECRSELRKQVITSLILSGRARVLCPAVPVSTGCLS